MSAIVSKKLKFKGGQSVLPAEAEPASLAAYRALSSYVQRSPRRRRDLTRKWKRVVSTSLQGILMVMHIASC